MLVSAEPRPQHTFLEYSLPTGQGVLSLCPWLLPHATRVGRPPSPGVSPAGPGSPQCLKGTGHSPSGSGPQLRGHSWGLGPRQQPTARAARTAGPLTNLQPWAPVAGEPGILPRPRPRDRPGPLGPAGSSSAPLRRPEPAPGARSSRGAQPQVQRSSAPPGPVADDTCRQPAVLATDSSVPSPGVARRLAAGTPPRRAQITALSSPRGPTPTAPGPGRSPAPRPTALLRFALTPLLSCLRIQSSPGHFQMSDFFRLFHLGYCSTHRGSLRMSLRLRYGLAFRAYDGGVQSTLRVRPPS
ncbi:hypothetical protein NDU88_005691 [Pleurodeles waltl]|uniref:Uncharacterized protein n=1 Tax=Pleurodeles waltl TaxID=8319 RepID=A0AAV7TBU7_PLEWA|nr:hypothetical protein NDU88_005691 [Pleurodeles waltl]